MDVISVHVPKTAGTAFGSVLATVYGDERVHKDYKDVPMNPTSQYHVDPEGWRASASIEVRSIGPEYRAIHGHFALEKYEDVFPEARRIAWVRHPAAWVISLYYFWKYHETTSHPLVQRLHARGLSIDEFAQDPHARDRISSIFLKGTPPEAFAFLGVQEHFDEDIKDLVRMMGWPDVAPGVLNPSPEPSYADRLREHHQDDRLIDRLVALNERDMGLYEAALRLRARRLEESQARAATSARLAAIREHANRDRWEGHADVA